MGRRRPSGSGRAEVDPRPGLAGVFVRGGSEHCLAATAGDGARATRPALGEVTTGGAAGCAFRLLRNRDRLRPPGRPVPVQAGPGWAAGGLECGCGPCASGLGNGRERAEVTDLIRTARRRPSTMSIAYLDAGASTRTRVAAVCHRAMATRPEWVDAAESRLRPGDRPA